MFDVRNFNFLISDNYLYNNNNRILVQSEYIPTSEWYN